MRQWKRESYSLHTDELGAGNLPLTLAVASLFEDLLQRAHPFGFFHEQPHSFFEVPKSLLFTAAARGNVQFKSLSHEAAPLFENAGGELNLHTCGG